MARPVQDIATGTRSVILDCAIPLFAKVGFDGVSMREIARAVGITPAALYYHFPDKDTLYFETMRHAYADQAESANLAFRLEAPAQERLQAYIARLIEFLYAEPDVKQLLQRERLDGDEHRMKLLIENLFQEQFEGLIGLARELAPDFDPHLWAISVAGLVIYHLETGSLRRFLPGAKPEHDDPAVVAGHVARFIMTSM